MIYLMYIFIQFQIVQTEPIVHYRAISGGMLVKIQQSIPHSILNEYDSFS
jgi:hypothetical protein